MLLLRISCSLCNRAIWGHQPQGKHSRLCENERKFCYEHRWNFVARQSLHIRANIKKKNTERAGGGVVLFIWLENGRARHDTCPPICDAKLEVILAGHHRTGGKSVPPLQLSLLAPSGNRKLLGHFSNFPFRAHETSSRSCRHRRSGHFVFYFLCTTRIASGAHLR